MKKFRMCLVLLVSMPFLQGASCLGVDKITSSIDKSVEKVTDSLQTAIDTLGTQSSAWQGTLTNLEHQVVADSEEVAGQVASLAKEGINFTGTQIQCRTDIVGKHMQAGLKNVLHRLKHEPEEIIPPTVCHVDPDHIDMNRSPTLLHFWGADLNTAAQQPQAYVVDANGTQVAIPAVLISRQSDYAMLLNVAPLINHQLTATSRKIIFKWRNQVVSQNEVPVTPLCGETNLVCCGSGAACRSASAVCIADKCVACGGAKEVCCSSNHCEGSLTCKSGKCAEPPELVQSLVVKIRTGDVGEAGTDDDVTLHLGLNHWNLDIPSYGDRERGALDTYVIDLGTKHLHLTDELNPIKIVKSADGTYGGWYLKAVQIEVNGRVLHHFEIDKWLEDNHLVWSGNIPDLPDK